MTATNGRLQTLRDAFDRGDWDGCRARLLQAAAAATDPTEYLALTRWRQRLRSVAGAGRPGKALRVALLGGATTDFLAEPLALALDVLGFDSIIHRADYNTFAGEMLDPDSTTVQFAPDIAVVSLTPANLPAWPGPGDDAATVAACVDETVRYWLHLCAALHEHARCDIVLDNFHRLPARPLGNLAAKTPADQNNFILRVNLALGERAPAYVHVNDVEALADAYGLRNWFDARFWYHAKQPMSFGCVIPYVRNTARIIAAAFGGSAKCLILDLDNTLWGGVVGDDGPAGIRIGAGDPAGEAHAAFQEYVLRLRQRGVLLAVCSKNDEAQARRPFRERPEMVLKESDFVAFRANWQPKPENIVSIAEELNLGLSSFVFVDDNPVEREHVRLTLPEVRVIEVSDDPADYIRALDDAAPFEVVSLSDEDRVRTQQYQANAARAGASAATGDYDSYLATLEQRAIVRPFDVEHIDRITQLINKTNQFNLTTERMARSQVEALMTSDAVTVYVRLSDRFGDNGLISVLAAHRQNTDYFVDLWLMSCRVLKRGVERLLCNHLVEQVRQRGGGRIFGVYRPTARNSMVAEHYDGLGFAALGEDADGTRHYVLEVAGYAPFDVAIRVDEQAAIAAQ